jgi:transposase
MRDRDFQAKILGIEPPWTVTDVRVTMKPEKMIETFVGYEGQVLCPQCARPVGRHDHRERRWRHLDIYEYKAYVVVQVPRVSCPEHGVVQLAVPFAEKHSGFTALFECLAISLLREMSISAVARTLHLSWDEVDGIMQRAVTRGLACRKERVLRRLGIDEKSVRKRRRYFTVVSDLDSGEVVWVGSGQRKETLDAFWRGLSLEQRRQIEGIAMDMSEAYTHSTLEHVPDAAHKIVFDKFHVVRHLNHAVDLERRAAGRKDPGLKHSRYSWLRKVSSMERAERRAFTQLRRDHARVARAWSIKELFAQFWDYHNEAAARRFFARWYGWAIRSRLGRMVEVARTLKQRFENILTYLRLPITNALAESMNSKIQWIKYQARGFRNEARFERAIYFHCAGLDLYPSHHCA